MSVLINSIERPLLGRHPVKIGIELNIVTLCNRILVALQLRNVGRAKKLLTETLDFASCIDDGNVNQLCAFWQGMVEAASGNKKEACSAMFSAAGIVGRLPFETQAWMSYLGEEWITAKMVLAGMFEDVDKGSEAQEMVWEMLRTYREGAGSDNSLQYLWQIGSGLVKVVEDSKLDDGRTTLHRRQSESLKHHEKDVLEKNVAKEVNAMEQQIYKTEETDEDNKVDEPSGDRSTSPARYTGVIIKQEPDDHTEETALPRPSSSYATSIDWLQSPETEDGPPSLTQHSGTNIKQEDCNTEERSFLSIPSARDVFPTDWLQYSGAEDDPASPAQQGGMTIKSDIADTPNTDQSHGQLEEHSVTSLAEQSSTTSDTDRETVRRNDASKVSAKYTSPTDRFQSLEDDGIGYRFRTTSIGANSDGKRRISIMDSPRKISARKHAQDKSIFKLPARGVRKSLEHPLNQPLTLDHKFVTVEYVKITEAEEGSPSPSPIRKRSLDISAVSVSPNEYTTKSQQGRPSSDAATHPGNLLEYADDASHKFETQSSKRKDLAHEVKEQEGNDGKYTSPWSSEPQTPGDELFNHLLSDTKEISERPNRGGFLYRSSSDGDMLYQNLLRQTQQPISTDSSTDDSRSGVNDSTSERLDGLISSPKSDRSEDRMVALTKNLINKPSRREERQRQGLEITTRFLEDTSVNPASSHELPHSPKNAEPNTPGERKEPEGSIMSDTPIPESLDQRTMTVARRQSHGGRGGLEPASPGSPLREMTKAED